MGTYWIMKMFMGFKWKSSKIQVLILIWRWFEKDKCIKCVSEKIERFGKSGIRTSVLRLKAQQHLEVLPALVVGSSIPLDTPSRRWWDLGLVVEKIRRVFENMRFLFRSSSLIHWFMLDHVGPNVSKCEVPWDIARKPQRQNLLWSGSTVSSITFPTGHPTHWSHWGWNGTTVQIAAPVTSRFLSGFPSGNRTAVSHIASLASRYAATCHRPGALAPRRRRQALAHSGCFSQKGSASNFTEPGLGILQTSGLRGPPNNGPRTPPTIQTLEPQNSSFDAIQHTCHQGFLWKGLHLEANSLFLGWLSSGNPSQKTGNQPNKFPGETLFPIRSNHIQNKLNPPKLIIPTIQPTEKKDT